MIQLGIVKTLIKGITDATKPLRINSLWGVFRGHRKHGLIERMLNWK